MIPDSRVVTVALLQTNNNFVGLTTLFRQQYSTFRCQGECSPIDEVGQMLHTVLQGMCLTILFVHRKIVGSWEN